MLTIDLHYKKHTFSWQIKPQYYLDIPNGILRDFSNWFHKELFDVWSQTFAPIFNSKQSMENMFSFHKSTLDKYWFKFLEYVGCI